MHLDTEIYSTPVYGRRGNGKKRWEKWVEGIERQEKRGKRNEEEEGERK